MLVVPPRPPWRLPSAVPPSTGVPLNLASYSSVISGDRAESNFASVRLVRFSQRALVASLCARRGPVPTGFLKCSSAICRPFGTSASGDRPVQWVWVGDTRFRLMLPCARPMSSPILHPLPRRPLEGCARDFGDECRSEPRRPRRDVCAQEGVQPRGFGKEVGADYARRPSAGRQRSRSACRAATRQLA